MNKGINILLVLFFLTAIGMVACGGGDNSPENALTASTEAADTTIASQSTHKLIIGNHTDKTGVASSAMETVNMALEDMVRYYDEQNLIPGIELEILTYDGAYDPARDIPGYRWLTQNGADILFTAVAPATITMKPYVAEDKVPLFTVSPTEEAFDPPGWVFASGNTLVQWELQTILKWIVENDPDFPTDRPAKIGGAFWDESYGAGCLAGARAYADAHPDQYEWVGGFLTPFKFAWDPEIEVLKDCDYVIPPVPSDQFLKGYEKAGGKGKFIGTDAHLAFLGQIRDAGVWDAFDGMWVVRPSCWWNDDSEVINLTKHLLDTYRPADRDEIIYTGVGYLATQQVYLLLQLINATVESVGPQNVNSQTIYDTALSFSVDIDGCLHSFTKTKRTSNDSLAIYQVQAARGDLFRADPNWLPILSEP